MRLYFEFGWIQDWDITIFWKLTCKINSKKANKFKTINTAYLLGVQYVTIWKVESVTAL